MSRIRSASATITSSGAKPTMWDTVIRSVKPPRSCVTGTSSVRPSTSQTAMSTAAFAVGLPTVRSMRACMTSRSSSERPTSSGAKIFSITAMIDSWVSP